jgi:hypothetical protein
MEALGKVGNIETYDALIKNRNYLDQSVFIDALRALDDIRAVDYLTNLLSA